MTLTLLNNRYRVLQTLGGGGFSNTFLAEDTHMPSARRCVIKQLKPVNNDPQTYKIIQERFQREAAVLEDLGDGNNQIPRLYAYFTEAGQFYLIQEFIEGDTLTKKVEKQGRLPEHEVKQILVSLLPVLDYVHGRQMVHRDIKPDNIIIRSRDNLPVLIDFGAVKEAMNTVVNDPRNSAQSMVIGTPGYMPSEQAGGRPNFASDLYSLGLTAIFLLTGKIPQELETDARTGEFMWRRHAPNINSNLAMVLDQAIRFNVRDRFGNAKAMLNALQSANVPNANAADSQMATVAVSPGVPHPPNRPAINNTPQTVPVARNPVISRDNGRKPLIIGALVAGILIVAATAIALGLRRNASTPTVADNVPITEPTSQQQSVPTPDRVPASLPTVSEPTQTRSQSTDNPPPAVTRQPSTDNPPPAVVSESPTPTPSQPSNSFPRRRPRSSQTDSDTTAASQRPRSSQTDSDTTAASQRPRGSQTDSDTTAASQSLNIPAFAPGTQDRYIKEELGNPTRVTNGYWQTRAALYQDIKPGVDLGYLFDRANGRLRQSEVTFDPAVGRETMSTTLNKILSNNTSADIQQGLQDVYQGKTNRYNFVSGRDGSLKGVIERNNRDRIYIAVWEADLH